MANDLPSRARVVIVGGGVIGCVGRLSSGQNRLERHRIARAQTAHQRHHLACGRTRRPAAPIHQHDPAGALHRRFVSRSRSRDRPGHGLPPMRLDFPGDHPRPHGRAQAQRLHGQGVRSQSRRGGPSEIRSLYPLANLDDVIGGIHIPSDGYANAVDITQALAKGARSSGVQIFQETQGHRHSSRRHGACAACDDRRAASMPTTWCSAAACGPGMSRPASA
jgi:glycine/D-amino acid oxidase-like deaminating enzyme